MARKKNPATTRPAPAPSAAHTAPAPAPPPTTPPDPASPAGAAHAALAAHPGGATTAAIATAIGIGRAAARDALTTLEAAGTVTRTKGGKPGVPDTWTLTRPAPDGSPDAAGQDQTASGTGQGPAGGGDATPQDGGDAGTGPLTPESGPGEQDGDAAPGGDPAPHGDGDAPPDQTAPADPGGEAAGAPDPALVTGLTERLDQIKAAAGAAGIALTGDTDLRAALAGLDEIAEQATAARRSLKTAIGGKKAPAVRPGGLRDKVLAHLAAHPYGEFTPHEIHKVLGHSSGAIANALDTLVKLGQAEVATDKPRRFRLAAQPAGAAPGADGGTELAGAA